MLSHFLYCNETKTHVRKKTNLLSVFYNKRKSNLLKCDDFKCSGRLFYECLNKDNEDKKSIQRDYNDKIEKYEINPSTEIRNKKYD